MPLDHRCISRLSILRYFHLFLLLHPHQEIFQGRCKKTGGKKEGLCEALQFEIDLFKGSNPLLERGMGREEFKQGGSRQGRDDEKRVGGLYCLLLLAGHCLHPSTDLPKGLR